MNQRVVLAHRPQGWVDESCLALEDCEEPHCGPGDVLLEAIYLSMDPYLRNRMNPAADVAVGLHPGQTMVSRVVARVLESGHPAYHAGHLVWGFLPWARRCCVARGEGLHRVDPSLGHASQFLSVLGMPGLTAWVGMIEIGRPLPGDTVLVSSAAGVVGQLAGQFARRAGARVVGSAGSAAKLAFVRAYCGFEAAFNYKGADLDAALRTHCPQGIDVYFENVGGAMLEAALRHANVGARFPMCGMISGYNETDPPGIRGLQSVLTRRITMTGVSIYDHVHKLAAYQERVAPWLRSGELVCHEDIVQGLEQAPAALVGMMRGAAMGKRLVQVAAE